LWTLRTLRALGVLRALRASRARFLGLLLYSQYQNARKIRMRRTPPPIAPPMIAQGGSELPVEVFEDFEGVFESAGLVRVEVRVLVLVGRPVPSIVVLLTLK